MGFDRLREEIAQGLKNQTALGISLMASLFVSIVIIAFQLINAGFRCYFMLTKENLVYFILDLGILAILVYWLNWSAQLYLLSTGAQRRIKK